MNSSNILHFDRAIPTTGARRAQKQTWDLKFRKEIYQKAYKQLKTSVAVEPLLEE